MTTIRDMSHWLELEKQKQLQSLRTLAFASAAHEFRNPLNSMILSLQLLAPTITDELALRYLMVATNCSKLMLFLVNDILDFSQHEQRKIILNMD
jgi:signal transduction histidine kinase